MHSARRSTLTAPPWKRSSRRFEPVDAPLPQPLFTPTSVLTGLAFFFLLLNTAVGTPALVGVLGVFAVIMALNWRVALMPNWFWLPALMLPVFAIISTAWSAAPELTFRHALQLGITAMFGLVVVNVLGPRQALAASFAAFLAVVVISLVSGREIGGALIGIFASKNFMAFATLTLLALSLAISSDGGFPKSVRLAAAPAIFLALYALPMANSAGANVGAGAVIGMFVLLQIIKRLTPTFRIVGLSVALILSVAVALNYQAVTAVVTDFVVNVLKKDLTFTGRTVFWDWAQQIIAQKPLLGQGYGVFWRDGSLDAETIWKFAGQTSGHGYNFHNEYVEWTVSGGYVGLTLFATLIGVNVLTLCAAFFMRPSAWLIGLMVVVTPLVLRTPTESTLVNEFSYYFVLFLIAGAYAYQVMRLGKP